MSICLSISTFKKLPALRRSLQQIQNIGSVSVVHVADDNDGEAAGAVGEFNREHLLGNYPYYVYYSTGPRGGIYRNKNRGIEFFRNDAAAQDCQYLLLADDDIVINKSTWGEPNLGDLFIKAYQHSHIPHITGYLPGSFGKVNPDGTITVAAEPFFTQFPVAAQDEYLQWCGGSMGVLLFSTRECIEKTGYFDHMPGYYGLEHSLWSTRSMRLFGRMPGLYPVLKYCQRYVGCQGVPNGYEAHPEENNEFYQKRMQEIFKGVGLYVRNPE